MNNISIPLTDEEKQTIRTDLLTLSQFYSDQQNKVVGIINALNIGSVTPHMALAILSDEIPPKLKYWKKRCQL